MVLQSRLDYGFNGYQVPYTPRATRSARRRGSFKKRAEDNKMCAFDLLATVAGKLLLEKESPPSSGNASTDEDQGPVVGDTETKESQDENKQLKVEKCDQGSCDRGFIVSELVSQAHDQKFNLKESPHHQDDAHFGFASAITTSDCSEGFGDQKQVFGKTENEMGTLASDVEVGPSGYREYGDCKLEVETKKIIKDESNKSGDIQFGGNMADGCSSDDPVVWDGKPSALVSSDSSAKVPLCRDNSPHSSFPATRDYVNVVSRDDDENSSGCTHPSTTKKFFRSTPRIGDRRIRKILASKYWKVAPKLKDVTLSNTDGELKAVYRNRNSYYRSLRSERNFPIKKRRLFSAVSNYDEGISGKNICLSPERGIDGDVPNLCHKMMHGAPGTSSSVAGSHSSFQSRNSHVKLRIKSFRVPELFIELPETATVGSLKRRVMEAVNAILGGGLRVGVLLQGKKVRDDSKTLLQTGIAHDNELDALGFSLEPNTSQNPTPLCPGDSPRMLPCNSPQPLTSLVTRYPAAPAVVHQGTCDAATELLLANIGNSIESDHDSAPSPTTDMSIDKSTNDSKALVAVPAISLEALSVVPVHRKSKRSEMVQRRIRRPFSVTEVEALVQAVEKLGTGRWRDVKLRAFDNAKHRTYVDLKDKWKTLVHTAKISPQQRRGEPVPQELLDRVLTAHAFWSQQQAKQQLKQQQQPQQQLETCLLL
ncbi:hypothetical protein Ddye_024294 [Dipteronia dyeriana]|uniref:Telomere repeat-binding protein 5 n=1 Tax=Dipteronia dyeriana TaxID=168575 RepID=A0AAD9TV58_9ROSI|nr:hypothetical protein Ddye_024294 [Dipteronia dyeriana]